MNTRALALQILVLSLVPWAGVLAQGPDFDDLSVAKGGAGATVGPGIELHQARLERLAADLAAQEARAETAARAHAAAVAQFEARLVETRKRLRQSQLQDAAVAAGRIANVLSDGPRMPNLYMSQTPTLEAQVGALAGQIESRKALAASEAEMMRGLSESSAQMLAQARSQAERDVLERLAGVAGLPAVFRELRIRWGGSWIERVEGRTRQGSFSLPPERLVAWVASDGESERQAAPAEAEKLAAEAGEAERAYRAATDAWQEARDEFARVDGEVQTIARDRETAAAAFQAARRLSGERSSQKQRIRLLESRAKTLAPAHATAKAALEEAEKARDALSDPAPLRARADAAAAHRLTVEGSMGKLGGVDPAALAGALGLPQPG